MEKFFQIDFAVAPIPTKATEISSRTICSEPRPVPESVFNMDRPKRTQQPGREGDFGFWIADLDGKTRRNRCRLGRGRIGG